MTARVMSVTLKPESIVEATAEWPEHIARFKGKGLVAGYLFVDHTTGNGLSITIWESADTQAANAASPEQAEGRTAMMRYFAGAPTPSVYTVGAVVR